MNIIPSTIINDDLQKKDQFIKMNIIKNIIECKTSNKYFELRENKIRQELNKIPVNLLENQKKEIIEYLNNINISFKKIPLKFQMLKASILIKNKILIKHYDVDYYKNKYEKSWVLYCSQ